MSRSKIEEVRDSFPDLSPNGFRTDPKRLGYPDRTDEWRATMLDDDFVEQFERSLEFLQRCEKTKSANRRHTSYGWKHVAERWHRKTHPGENPYIANGMFIAAALSLGFKVTASEYGGPNCFLNISEKSIPVAEDNTEMRQERRDACGGH